MGFNRRKETIPTKDTSYIPVGLTYMEISLSLQPHEILMQITPCAILYEYLMNINSYYNHLLIFQQTILIFSHGALTAIITVASTNSMQTGFMMNRFNPNATCNRCA